MLLLFFVIAAAAVAAISLPQQKQERKTKYIRDRMEWLRHVEELEEESPTSFIQLYQCHTCLSVACLI